MKYSFTVLGLFLVLCVTLFSQDALSQQVFDVSSLVDPNTGLPTGVEEQISAQQIPSIPKAGERVSIRLTSYLSDLNKANIAWSIDGKIITTQQGATLFEFTAPQSGRTSTITVRIEKDGGGVVSKTFVISPADVDLIYEAQTYAHPFFKGKKRYTSEAVVDFIAIPNFTNSNGTQISATGLVYTWKINGTVQQASSGYGRNILTLKGSLIERPAQVTVEVSAPNSSLKATQSISITSTRPEAVLYENNPLLGIVYEKAIQGTFFLERPQVDFEAVPYFFSAEYKDELALQYQWSINGTRIQSKPTNENYLLLRNDKNEEGKALINLSLMHATNIMQNATASIELDFIKVENEPNEQFTF